MPCIIRGLSVYSCMINQTGTDPFSTASMEARIATLEMAIVEKDSAIVEKDSAILKLTTDLEAARFQNDQMRRMIFGSKRERFVQVIDINQLRLEFEPKTAEISQAVKAERELIRVEYERRKVKKEHPGRMALPSHLPVVETVIEPSEDTTGMVCREFDPYNTLKKSNSRIGLLAIWAKGQKGQNG